MNAYSPDLGLKALDAVDRGGIPRKEVVRRTFGVSMPASERYPRRRREGAGSDPGRSPGRTPSICASAEERRLLWKQLEENNEEATLEHHCELWEREQRATRVSVSTMSRAVSRLGWTFKKGRRGPPSETKMREVLGASA